MLCYQSVDNNGAIVRTITLKRPDDWHVHLRDGEYLPDTVNATAQHFSRALIMPNLKPALTSLESLLQYRQRILNALNPKQNFTPYLTFYLNEAVCADDLQHAKAHPFILGGKLYPAGVTTNAEQGAQSITALYPLLDIMQQQDLVLQIHGEVNHSDIFDRERLFLAEQLTPIMRNFPKLRIVLEHISTKAAVRYVEESPNNLAATVTPHHLLYDRNHLLAQGIKPHYYCLPILKTAGDRTALMQAVTSGNPKFFAGTDSAPHTKENKENVCGCAGIYSAPFALALYAKAFAETNQLHRLNDFLSIFGANFYHLPPNQDEVVLIEKPQIIPNELPFGSHQVIPLAAGSNLSWSVQTCQ